MAFTLKIFSSHRQIPLSPEAQLEALVVQRQRQIASDDVRDFTPDSPRHIRELAQHKVAAELAPLAMAAQSAEALD